MKKFKHVNGGKIHFYRIPGYQIAGLMDMYVEQKAYCETAPQRSCTHKPQTKPRTHNKEYLWIIPN
ncbi:MAG: hypothetical protein PHD87_07065 [Candidatus Cloacimonetes bacterium]|nr:hypothetical protein [Candidatus Cloacimonadota bacterium]